MSKTIDSLKAYILECEGELANVNGRIEDSHRIIKNNEIRRAELSKTIEDLKFIVEKGEGE